MSKLTTNDKRLTTSSVYAVVLVGGKGKRLRPVSTPARPKAFLEVFRERQTMFKKTLERIAGLIPLKKIIVVANKRHAHHVKRDFPDIARGSLLLEPVSRNTAPAIAFAASVLRQRHKDAIMVVLPIDHYITGVGKYRQALKRAVAFIQHEPDAFVTIGVKPTFPATGFGYVKLKTQISKLKTEKIGKVARFVEKPDLKCAERFLEDGGYLWNSGIFLFRASALLEAVRRYAPRIYRILGKPEALGACYKRLPNISIDYAVMEKARNIYCVMGEFGWRDMGSHEALKEALSMEGLHEDLGPGLRDKKDRRRLER